MNFTQAHSQVDQYDPELWNTLLLLIPADLGDRWVLFAVTNMARAQARTSVAPPLQTLVEGELKPDSKPFAILALDSQGERHTRGLTNKIKSYLDWHYLAMRGEALEFVDSHNAKVGETPAGLRVRFLNFFTPVSLPTRPC